MILVMFCVGMGFLFDEENIGCVGYVMLFLLVIVLFFCDVGVWDGGVFKMGVM